MVSQPASDAPRFRREADDRLIAGVAAGLARHLGIAPLVTRLAFLALGIGGVGVAVYVTLVFLVPAATTESGESGEEGERKGRGRDLKQLLAYLAIAVGLGALLLVFGGVFDPLLWFLIFGALGGTILWQQANPTQRDEWISSIDLRHRRSLIRSGAGVVLVLVGVTGFLAFRQELSEARQGLSATLAMLAGIALIAAPWIVGLVRERDRERRERIRSQERAEFAAHIHDSVLHTLTLIQRNADDGREVQRLARVQERELRNWLYQRPADAESTLKPALEQVAAEVESDHGVAIEVVCVGDCPIEAGIQPALRAAREAMVNSAKHANATNVSVYGEVEPEQVLIFVRDRGDGFDVTEIPSDRMGVRDSIIGRMERYGGSARVRTAPGEGTEVQLRMPREAASG